MYVQNLTAAMLGVILLLTISGQALSSQQEIMARENKPVVSLVHLLENPRYFKIPQNRSKEEMPRRSGKIVLPEHGEYAEGDIIGNTPSERINGLIDAAYRWPYGVVYYTISDFYNEWEQNLIQAAINHFHTKTCIRFVKRSTEPFYIEIAPYYQRCFSEIGFRRKSQQTVNLAYDCLNNFGTIIHELMHSLGFLHEHTRNDRDNFVEIKYNNILPGFDGEFNKTKDTWDWNVPYDYFSIMHYSTTAFSVDNKSHTIEIKKKVPYAHEIGRGYSLRDSDALKINRMYLNWCSIRYRNWRW